MITSWNYRNQKRLIGLLREIKIYEIDIDWEDIVQMQITCIRNGVNGVGIPDLIIAQNAIQNDLSLLSTDRHFISIAEYTSLSLHN